MLNSTLSEEPGEDGGGKFYTQSLSFDLAKVDLIDNIELPRLTNKDYSSIVSDRNGLHRILGLRNGLITELTKVTGGDKAGFNGYKLTMEGQEAFTGLFINDLDDAGFEVAEDNFLLLENGEFILLEDNQRIILE